MGDTHIQPPCRITEPFAPIPVTPVVHSRPGTAAEHRGIHPELDLPTAPSPTKFAPAVSRPPTRGASRMTSYGGPNDFFQRLARTNTIHEDPRARATTPAPARGAYVGVGQTTRPVVVVPHQVAQSYVTKPYADPGVPLPRAGRLGAPWRHVRQCTGNLGNHICFIDGAVKQDDLTSYPPYGYFSQAPTVLHKPQPRISVDAFPSATQGQASYWNRQTRAIP